ncbi:MAG: hypothetical protein HKO48_05015 [Nitrosopumilus sp.]|nr:hypothetical protein [Nitrosopumilus sp.]NNL37207.1 hypothetical protein [Nitrosopumilus sp.]NNM36457.1 hypothetical protein [Nitrosopumilus sp.]
MTLFCKQCNERRLPIVQQKDKAPLWLCEKCENFTDIDDMIIREQTKEEKEEAETKLEEFQRDFVSTGEKKSRRKGVN